MEVVVLLRGADAERQVMRPVDRSLAGIYSPVRIDRYARAQEARDPAARVYCPCVSAAGGQVTASAC